MTVSELLHLIGELIIVDINKVNDVNYPKNEPYPSRLEIVMKSGKRFGVFVTELKKE